MRDFQTLNFVRQQLARRGLRPNTGLGQHFLIDGNLLHQMVKKARVGKGDLVLEVGCGTGSLTELLARQAGHVIAVELDARLLDIAREALAGCDSVTFYEGDVLASKRTLEPGLLRLVNEHLQAHPRRRLTMVSDLPYKVATPVIVNLWESGLPLEVMVITVQRELAERLVARPGTKAYGAVTVKVAVWADAEVLRLLPASVFWPRPAVQSAFVRLRRRREPVVSVGEYAGFAALVEGLFRYRRKTLKRALAIAAREPGSAGILRVGSAADRPDARRVDHLTLEELLCIWRALGQEPGTNNSEEQESAT